MLFSEPKIPQCRDPAPPEPATCTFQCSSASRKFLNDTDSASGELDSRCFSALQRAENSSISPPMRVCSNPRAFAFQCSSASRKFLNSAPLLQSRARARVSVLFSEPKIPQLPKSAPMNDIGFCVSVLFSEPKIPQYYGQPNEQQRARWRFQCSSASRKFLNSLIESRTTENVKFQCSSASRKFLNFGAFEMSTTRVVCFSALQRAENSSIAEIAYYQRVITGFSALQRAENSSISDAPQRAPDAAAISVLFSEPKIPQCIGDEGNE